MENKYFKSALYDFAQDMANGGAIRHLWDLGYSIHEIMPMLDYPASYEKIQDVVWEHLIDTGVICLEKPEGKKTQKAVYVKEYDKYGRSSFRKVEKAFAFGSEMSYIPCDYGLIMYRDRKLYLKLLDCLDERQREYITDVPWKRMRVYHILDERMKGIEERLRMYKS